jgi:hypothetical protein
LFAFCDVNRSPVKHLAFWIGLGIPHKPAVGTVFVAVAVFKLEGFVTGEQIGSFRDRGIDIVRVDKIRPGQGSHFLLRPTEDAFKGGANP